MRLRENDAREAVDALLAAHQADTTELPPPAQGRFSRDEIIRSIHDWTLRYGEPPKVFDWDPSWARRRGEAWRAERFEAGEWPTVAIIRRQFGTMSKALFAAGVRPRRGPTKARGFAVTDEHILEAIREWTARYGEPPCRADWSPTRARNLGQSWRADRYHAGDWPSFSTVIRRYGTLTAAVRAAGLEPRPRGVHTRRGADLDPHVREVLSAQLVDGRCGPQILAARVRSIASAREAADHAALRGALIDLAAAALAWADEVPSPSSERAAA